MNQQTKENKQRKKTMKKTKKKREKTKKKPPMTLVLNVIYKINQCGN